jgi:hypothetical protein
MAARVDYLEISGSVATGTTAVQVLGSPLRGLTRYDWFMVDASIAGVPLGTLDVYLQRQIATTLEVTGGVWADWIHFPQRSEAGARVYYSVQPNPSGDIVVVGRGTDASGGTPALAANTSLGGHPGNAVRLVAKCSAATMTGVELTVSVSAWQGTR